MCVSNVDGPLVLVQVTDSHLFAADDGRLMGLDTADSLSRVVGLIRDEQPRVDLILATGDLSQDGSEASYRRFAELTAPLASAARWISGNHDERQVMESCFGDTDRLQAVTDMGNWRIVMLHSSIEGAVPGFLDADELATLESALSGAGDRHVLICLHHHPLAIGSRWMDAIGLRNPDPLFALLDRHPQVRGLLWGHVHQAFDQWRNEVRLLASPSTCVQFTPGSEAFSVSREAPGYRWLQLHSDGRLDTGVSRLASMSFPDDFGSGGY